MHLDALEGSFTLNMIMHLSCFHPPCQSLRREPACCWVHFCLNSICNIHWDPHLSACKSDWYHNTQYLKGQCAALKMCKLPIREFEREIDSDNDSLLDRLVNTVKHERVPQTTQECTNADYDLTETNDSVSEVPRRFNFCVYTYNFLN